MKIQHKEHIWAGFKPAHIIKHSVSLTGLCILLILAIGCGGAGQSVDAMFTTASSHLASAQKAGAEKYAKSEFDEASALLTEAETAIANKDKEARSIAKKALLKARLAEALTRQSKAEEETARLEAELEMVFSEAAQARQERQSAEEELEQMSSE